MLDDPGVPEHDSPPDKDGRTFFKSEKFIEHFEQLACEKREIFGSQGKLDTARKQITFFLGIIMQTDPAIEAARLRQVAMTANGDEAVAAAQAVIVARRRRADRQDAR